MFIDLQKAFDTVDHEILLEKLEHYGIRGLPYEWFKSYLSDRQQFVSLSGYNSNFLEIMHGVPQGSVLDPLLFLLYTNDLPNSTKYSDSTLFADDTVILYSSNNLDEIEHCVNYDLNELFQWLNSNKIALNVAKTEVLLFRDPNKKIDYPIELELNGNVINFSSVVNYLGILLDEHLSWSINRNFISGNLRKANGIISKMRHYLPLKTMLSIYYALFHSHLCYGAQVWGQNIVSNSRIFKLQKSAVRLLTFETFNSHTKPLFIKLQIPTLINLIASFNMQLTHKILNSVCPENIQNIFQLSYLQHEHYTRGQRIKLLARPFIRTSSYGLNSIRYQSILIWNIIQANAYDVDLSSISLKELKILVKIFNDYILE